MMIDKLLKRFHLNKRVALVVFIIIAALFMFFWGSKPTEVPATAETTQNQNAQTEQAAADEEKAEDSGFHINIGWSNIAVFGGLVIALGVVKYKKNLKTDKEDLKETE
jgi:predicted negative regulator of RcsB-dependent stress response